MHSDEFKADAVAACAQPGMSMAAVTMDQFGLLVACDVPRRVNGLLLRVVHGGCPLIAGTLDGPTVLVRNYVLILPVIANFLKLNHRNPASRPGCRVANDHRLKQNSLLLQTTGASSQINLLQS